MLRHLSCWGGFEIVSRMGPSLPQPSHSHSRHDHPALPALPQAFFCRPAEVVAPDLIGLLVKRQPTGELLSGAIVEMEASLQEGPALGSMAFAVNDTAKFSIPI